MERTFIIAEAGVNHNGSLERALAMVREARRMGADAIKFQTFRASDLVTADAPKADYQNEGDDAPTQYEMLKRLELSDDDHRALIAECDKMGIEFMSTPFSVSSAKFLYELGMKIWKIPSGEITNLPLLEYIAPRAGKVILSTGMSTMDEISEAVTILLTSKLISETDPMLPQARLSKERLYLLHCTTAYPTPLADVNLRVMDALRKFACAGVGYSDHTPGTLVPVAAVAMGAVVIEKHFTLDKNLPGPDHKASLTPDEFAAMVRDIRLIETALGSDKKQVVKSEKDNIKVARKSIVAAVAIKKGDCFSADNLTTKRPGTGLSPMLWYRLIGKKARHDYRPDDPINKDELK